ncbi:aldehyde dehydrogenase family protein [Thalassospira xiamenensis]|jgi:aldehyde dehydrogenase (NAD+)|uniref:aldehyde dehydrogenase family protein n=1 Tax=Thalassospira xiamenensis TaxID=220697 RepID=UPI003AA8CEE6
MHQIDKVYINGEFVTPKGSALFDLYNPATGAVNGQVRLANRDDAQKAIAAAKAAFPAFSQSSKETRLALLQRLYDAVVARADDITAAVVEEYGGPVSMMSQWTTMAAQNFLDMADTLESYDFTQKVRASDVVMIPIGVVGIIIPWNSNVGFITSRLATAIAAGCCTVIKPSEMSALQTQVVCECLHAAGLPKGVLNVVTGTGIEVGAEIARNPDVAKISFTGSTAVGKDILRASADTMKRVTLELGGKSPTIILDDADLDAAVPLILAAGFLNSGQACIAGTRVLVVREKHDELAQKLIAAMNDIVVAEPTDPASRIGPMVSRKQYERVQGYIIKGIEEGADLLAGGPGHPEGLGGYFVRPTLFGNVDNAMTIARDEIFGPVLCLIPYEDEEQAITIANDTDYGLAAYVMSSDPARAGRVAERIDAGRVCINGFQHEPQAPFGGFKQSGIGRQYGVHGLESHLEPKVIMGR